MQQYCPGFACRTAIAASAEVLFPAVVTIAGAPGPLGALKMGLIGALNGPASPFTALGDITLPIYSTYALGATTVWSVTLNEADGSLTVSSQLYVWQQTGATGDTIVGAFLAVDSAPDVIYAVCTFTTPIPLISDGDGFTCLVEWNLQANTGGSTPAVVFQVNS